MKFLILILIVWNISYADSFSPKERQDYTAKVMNAFKKVPRADLEKLYQFINLTERNTCKSGYETLTLGCLKKEVIKNCRETDLKNCALLSDIVLVNKVNEKSFVNEGEKLKLASAAKNYGQSYSRMLLRKYALLATEFIISSPKNCSEAPSCLTQEFDKFCLKNSRDKGLPWQACVSALVWFTSL